MKPSLQTKAYEPGKAGVTRVTAKDTVSGAVVEGVLILIAGLAALLLHEPLFFASMGATAFEIAETPERPSATPYGVMVGHLVGVACGFAALWMTQAWHAPKVDTSHLALVRVVASVLAVVLTVVGNAVLRSTQPAALATTLLITMGLMQRPSDAWHIMLGVLVLDVVGEPLRRFRVLQRAA